MESLTESTECPKRSSYEVFVRSPYGVLGVLTESLESSRSPYGVLAVSFRSLYGVLPDSFRIPSGFFRSPHGVLAESSRGLAQRTLPAVTRSILAESGSLRLAFGQTAYDKRAHFLPAEKLTREAACLPSTLWNQILSVMKPVGSVSPAVSPINSYKEKQPQVFEPTRSLTPFVFCLLCYPAKGPRGTFSAFNAQSWKK